MIIGITGPEGSGKTCLMTALLRDHYSQTKGNGKIFAFPGYQLFNTEGKIVSREMGMADWVNLPPNLQNAVIAVDEIQNFFNSAYWGTMVNQLFSMVAAQRRKRNLVIIYTGQMMREVPNRVRDRTHYFIECFDLYHKYPNQLERGTQIAFRTIDNLGFLTGIPYFRLPAKKFYSKPYWKFYDTHSVVDIHFADKVRLKGRELEVSPDGAITDTTAGNGHDKEAIRTKLIELRTTMLGQEWTMSDILDAIGEKKAQAKHVSEVLLREWGYRKKQRYDGQRVYLPQQQPA